MNPNTGEVVPLVNCNFDPVVRGLASPFVDPQGSRPLPPGEGALLPRRAGARSLYSKAGLTGRAALSAFFLEDLLAPIEGVDGAS